MFNKKDEEKKKKKDERETQRLDIKDRNEIIEDLIVQRDKGARKLKDRYLLKR